jgi:branched-chain amino acid transport system ATP-binding protein
MALGVAHRGYVLQSGRVTHADSAEHLRNDETVIEAYLGG